MVLGSIDVFPVDQAVGGSIIELRIEDCAARVFDGVLDGGDDDNDDEGNSRKTGIGSAEDGKDL